MKKGVTVITPTGDRPEAFRLCCKYMERQTRKPDQWIIVDDGIGMDTCVHQIAHIHADHIVYAQRHRQKHEPRHTLTLNLLEALPLVQFDTILIMEDDDWYHSGYVEWMYNHFLHTDAKLIGQGYAVYYHVPSQRYKMCPNSIHASLCQTGFRSSELSRVEAICKTKMTNPFVDIKLWQKTFSGDKLLLDDDTKYCVGIKGMPGRQGVCAGWTQYMKSAYTQDTDYEYLRNLIGDDVNHYRAKVLK